MARIKLSRGEATPAQVHVTRIHETGVLLRGYTAVPGQNDNPAAG